MSNINQWIISGRLTSDPETRNANGKDLLRVNLAHNVYNGKDKPDTVMYIEVTAWKDEKRGIYEELTDLCLVKGQEICVSGRLNTRVHDGKTYLMLNYPILHGSKPYVKRDPLPESRHNTDTAGTADDVPF
jgi:single-stranded DNA-binding protein